MLSESGHTTDKPNFPQNWLESICLSHEHQEWAGTIQTPKLQGALGTGLVKQESHETAVSLPPCFAAPAHDI